MTMDEDRPAEEHAPPDLEEGTPAADGPVDGEGAAPVERLEALGEELRGLSKGIADLWVGAMGRGSPAVRVVVKLAPGAERERQELATRLIQHGAEAGEILVPLVYSAAEWARLEGAAPGESWLGVALRGEGDRAPLVELYRQHRNHPRALRRMLLKVIREHQSTVLRLRRTTTIPIRLGAALCSALVEECLELLFGLADGRLRGTAEDVVFFNDRVLPGTRFRPDDAVLHLRLAGLAEQIDHDQLLTGKRERDRKRYDWPATVRRVGAFLDAFERHVRHSLASAADRRLRRRLWLAGMILAVCMVVGGLGWSFITTRHRQPLSDGSVVRHRGGIKGVYFKGREFDQRVFSRIDRTLSPGFGAKAPDTKLPADDFSIRWEGYVYFGKAGAMRLCAWADDGVRVIFDEDIELDDWRIGPPRMPCERINVLKGWYPIKVEYFEAGGPARLKLLVGRDREHLHNFARNHLCCTR